MSPRTGLRWLLAFALAVSFGGTPSAQADIVPPKPKPEPKPPKPQPPLPPEPEPIPDDPDDVQTAVVAGAAALGITLFGVWAARRAPRRVHLSRPALPTPS